MELVNVLKKPFTDIRKLFVGSILGGIPILNFFVVGYSIESTKGDLPDFNAQQFILGLKAKIIMWIYSLVQMLIMMALVVTSGNLGLWQDAISGPAPQDAFVSLIPQTFGNVGLLGFMLLSLVLSLFGTFAVIEMVQSNSIKKGFNLIKVIKGSLNGVFLKAWAGAFLLQLIIVLALSIVFIPISWVPVIPFGLINFVSTMIFWNYLSLSVKII